MGLYEASGCKLNRELCTAVEEKYPDASLIFENNPYELLYLIDDNQDYKTAVSFFKIMHKPTDENIALYYNTDNFSAVIEQENEIR